MYDKCVLANKGDTVFFCYGKTETTKNNKNLSWIGT
jgi:hypothetical protein